MKIGLFDSGKGGTTVLAAIKEILPDEEYRYIADSKNCPYGEKTDQELIRIVTRHVENLKKWGAKIIVVACNTATTRCIDQLRVSFPELQFIGTEPAIRLATNTDASRILVMATPGTVKSERTIELVHENQKPGQQIDLLSCPGLADAIEKDNGIDDALSKVLKKSINQKYDLVVLGCTHYSIIKDKIQKYFPDATLIDGNIGVAKRTKQIVDQIKAPLR